MKERNGWLARLRAAGALAGLLCCVSSSNLYAQIVIGSAFQGEAVAVTGIAAGSVVSVADTGALLATGSAQEAAAMETTLAGGISVGVSHAAIIGEESVTSSEAAVADVSFTENSSFSFFLAPTTITADFVMSQATAACGAAGAIFSGQVQITGLVINGQAIAVTGAANQVVLLADGGFVIINEQLASGSTFTVNGLHVFDTLAGVDVVFASASAGITCGSSTVTSTPPAPCDFITGGGWIIGPTDGAKANFGVAGGIKDGAFWGHLNYIDHGNGMHVKATAVTGYAVDPNDANCRTICYDVTVNDMPGWTATVTACDNGEPGWSDTFQIQLCPTADISTPNCPPTFVSPCPTYSASGDLGGSQPGGGNIQLHNCQQ
jgi:hypothetical protein